MNITIEMAGFFIALLSLLGGGFFALMNKLEKIWQVISKMQKDYVEHDVCQNRRDRCPCVSDIKRIENSIEKTITKR